MKRNFAFEKFILLYLPWLIAVIFKNDPTFSYLTAWLGSFVIFFLTLTGQIVPLPADRNFGSQVMRPIILIQIIFAGYMCCTSIFYFMSLFGYTNFQPVPFYLVDEHKLDLTAQCQRYYCLGHAAMVTGMLIFMQYPKPKYKIQTEKLTSLLFYSTVCTFPLSVFFLKFPGLGQFATQFSSLSFMSAALSLAFVIPQKKVFNIVVCFFFYSLNFYLALISGFKEPIILSVLVLGVFLYPIYKKTVLIVFVPILLMLFLVLPTYVNVIRQNSWSGDEDSDDAASEALNVAITRGATADETTWTFLVTRLTEIDMFTLFLESTPEKVDFYHFQLLDQAAAALIPRVFWPSKASTEQVVMQRVYDAGVVNQYSKVSAKPAFVVDAYLSWGGIGVFVFLFLYGATAQLISRKAESLFGGYILGTALVFSGLFQIFWRGLSFEFLANNIFWGYISMLLLAHILRRMNILLPA